MQISEINISNFRKLKKVSIHLHKDTTLFIGANNSGKTSSMVAMRYFLKKPDFNIYDFTLSNHQKIKDIGSKLEIETDKDPVIRDLSLWKDILPSLDIWFNVVDDDDIHYVSHILPTLDWTGGNLGIRLSYEPKDIDKLYSDYVKARETIKNLKVNKNTPEKQFNTALYPKDILDFLKKELNNYFGIKFYILDPVTKNIGNQIDDNPLIGLIQVDEINAQRGLSDDINDHLSTHMVEYYHSHLDPSKSPNEHDLEALDAIYKANETSTENMRSRFKGTLKEVETLGYPGFNNPKITIHPQINPTDGLNHSSALQYELEGCNDSFLPEMYNGLGYQNLILMAFKLIKFRDSWLKIGKQRTEQSVGTNIEYPPIHLVLIEEPEAHLHPQAQQVFINKAYEILQNRSAIGIGKLTTQLIITTHSSHITHECEFEKLRYFKRIQPTAGEVQSSEIVDLSNVFGTDKDTEKFVERYIKLTHCDLFFADAAILIEGDAERILLPNFIRKFTCLTQSYISLISIGGSHAHKLQPLMEILGIPTLIITDLDATVSETSQDKNGTNRTVNKSAPTEKNKNQKTGNETLRKWLPKQENIDDLLGLTTADKKQDTPFALRVAYQVPITVSGLEVLPYTFEDSLIFENKSLIDGVVKAKGMIKKAQSITDAQSAFDIIRDSEFKKAEFALDLLYIPNFENIIVPDYIKEGLEWLNNLLKAKLETSPLTLDNGEEKNV